jgi:hypothetical protein
MSTRWNKDEELKLIKSISNGQDLESISKNHNRSVSAVELRLKKIIYENASQGKSIEKISKMLKLPNDKVKQYFYSYKEFAEKHNTPTQSIKPEQHVQPVHEGGEPEIYKDNKVILHGLEIENKILKLVVENRELKHKLNNLIKEGSVDKGIKDFIKQIKNNF